MRPADQLLNNGRLGIMSLTHWRSSKLPMVYHHQDRITNGTLLAARANGRAPPVAVLLEDRRLLSTFTVTSTLDNGSVGTLRWAVGQANSAGGAETIAFDKKVFKTPQTITLTGTQLELTDTTGTETITGPKAGVTVSGGGLSRVFQVDGGVTASISGLTITGGNTPNNGGGLYNDGGTATLTNCTVSGNTTAPSSPPVRRRPVQPQRHGHADQLHRQRKLRRTTAAAWTTSTARPPKTAPSAATTAGTGGGVYNGGSTGTATLTNTTVSGNSAGFGGGITTLARQGHASEQLHRQLATPPTGGGGLYNSTARPS